MGRKKGFEFWSEKEFGGVGWWYWGFYALIFLIGTWVVFIHKEFSWLMIISLIPHVLLKTAYYFVDPTVRIEDGLKKYEPEFFKELEDRLKDTHIISIFSSKKTIRQAQILSALVTWDKPKPPIRIQTYKNNVKRITCIINF